MASNGYVQFDPAVIEQARQIDLLSYLQRYEPNNLKRVAGNVYCTKEHDSLKISNGKWMWWSRGIGGNSALDYLVKVKGLSFLEAVETIMGCKVALPTDYCTPKKETPKELKLPPKSASTDRITEYLFGRGIDYEIITHCIQKGLIFESLPYHNAVFVGKDEKGTPRYAAYRATNKSRLMGDASGSDKHYSFRLEGSNNSEVHLYECAIDALSYATLMKMNGDDWRKENLVSLAGVYAPREKIEESKVPAAVEGFLKSHPEIKRIVLHFDNDEVGRKATQALQIILSDRYEVIDSPPKFGKDFNDFLCMKLGIYKSKQRSFER